VTNTYKNSPSLSANNIFKLLKGLARHRFFGPF
jgi:hypothetical protein